MTDAHPADPRNLGTPCAQCGHSFNWHVHEGTPQSCTAEGCDCLAFCDEPVFQMYGGIKALINDVQQGCPHRHDDGRDAVRPYGDGSEGRCELCGDDTFQVTYDPAADPMISPSHYQAEGNAAYETIKVLAAWMSPEELVGFCKGNAIKYLSRAGKKPGQPAKRDYSKARWYLDRLIEGDK